VEFGGLGGSDVGTNARLRGRNLAVAEDAGIVAVGPSARLQGKTSVAVRFMNTRQGKTLRWPNLISAAVREDAPEAPPGRHQQIDLSN
jgi:hypothetical protein